MAKVLYLTQVLPYPLDAGPKVRAYHMLRHLAGKHSVTLVSFVRPDDLPSSIHHLEGICSEVHTAPIVRSVARNIRAGMKGLATGLPVVVARDEMGDMFGLLERLASSDTHDIVHADQLSMAGYAQFAAHASRSRPKTLLDEHNAIYVLANRIAANERNPLRRLVARREARAFKRYEAGMLRSFDRLLTVTHEDRDRLLALVPEEERPGLAARMAVVPICVDVQETLPIPRRPDGPPLILHLGTMFWPPNVEGVLWFATQVFPLVRKSIPDARFRIVGKKPPASVSDLTADPQIEVTGYVTDPTPHLASTDAFVVPLHAGSGMRVKILDAWAWGLPVVSTAIGAEGIDVCPGENILIADGNPSDERDPQSFADSVVRVLSDRSLNSKLRSAGRAYVENRYSWQAVYATVDAVYDSLVEPSAETFPNVSRVNEFKAR
jgi:glycosyltransferase involved in cell wall biosynthesis